MNYIRNGFRLLGGSVPGLSSVEDAHAEPSNLLGIVGLGVIGDVAPAEAVSGEPVQPGEGGCHKLSYRFRLGFQPVTALRFEGAMDCVAQLVKEDVCIFGGEHDGLVGVVGG